MSVPRLGPCLDDLVRPDEEVRGERHPAVGQKITTFALQPLTGDSREVTEADLAEKVTLVNFWGPWCGACAVEFPHLVEVSSVPSPSLRPCTKSC